MVLGRVQPISGTQFVRGWGGGGGEKIGIFKAKLHMASCLARRAAKTENQIIPDWSQRLRLMLRKEFKV